MAIVDERVADDPARAGRFDDQSGANLRTRTARGTIINGSFLIAATALTLVQGTLVARWLSPTVIGRFELLMAVFMAILTLGSVGVDDKYVQQNDSDQQRAFEIAFTLLWLLAGALAVLMLVGIPLFAMIYQQPSIVVPGLALILGLPAIVFQMPIWVHYRRMDFLRQRRLQMLNAVVMFAATVGLVLAGFGIWALVIGGLAASWVTAGFSVRSCPYRLRLRWERGALKEYRRFSVPLFISTINVVLMWQIPVVLGARLFGAAAVAGIAMSLTISQFTTQVDNVITATLYPAICAVRERRDVLFESFWKSNRLALLWAAPLGCAAALFIGDFVHYVIGEKWRFAVPLLAITGVSAAVNQIGFNWTAFYRAIGNTKPMAVVSVISLAGMAAIAAPLLVTHGVTGFGVGMGIVMLITLGVRMHYLMRLFPSLAMARHIARGIVPCIPGTLAVIGLRVADGGPRTLARVASEVVLFAGLTIVITYVSERELLGEAVGYLRRRSAGAPAIS